MQPSEEFRYLLLAAQREGNRLFTEALRPLDLTPSQAEVLRMLQEYQAGKRHNRKSTKGNSYLRSVLVQVAWVLTRMSDNYLSAQFHHLKPRLGAKKAVVAVAHSVLVIVYHVLTKGEPYQDLGTDYFRQQNKEQQAQRFISQLETLGYHVELAPQEEETL